MSGTQIFELITGMLSGLALFIFGMNVMSDTLTLMAGGSLSGAIDKLTGKRIAGWAFGTLLAVFVQSSVTTVMTVGLVNSEIITVAQSVGVMIGANLGTTATAWLLSLNSLGGSFLLTLLKPSSFTPFLAIGGVVYLMFAKSAKKRSIGTIIVGFSVMMIGMDTMSNAVEPLQNVPAFNQMMFSFSNPFLGVLVGIACTLLIQSSAAAIGILQALAMSVGVTYSMAIPIVCGAQLGTCMTAILASLSFNNRGKRAALIHLIVCGAQLGTCMTAILASLSFNNRGKRAALIHLSYNLIRNTLFLVIFYLINAIVGIPFLKAETGAVGIAAFHTLINLAGSAVFLPLGDFLVKLVHRILPFNAKEKEEEADTLTMLNPLFLSNPSFALDQVWTASSMLGDAVQEYFDAYLDMIGQNLPEQPDKVRELGEKTERYVSQLRKYCLRLSQQKMQDKAAGTLSLLTGSINNYAEMAEKITAMKETFLAFRKEGTGFSEEAAKDLKMFGSAVQEILEVTVHNYTTRNTRLAGTIQVYREVITDMLGKINRRSVRRLHNGICSPEGSRTFSEICTGYERIIDRCDSIARHILRISQEPEVPPTQEQYDAIKALFEDKFEELE